MFMATARIDAVWVHDGLLDARDYKTGGLWHDRVADVPAAKVQAFVLAEAARKRGLRLRLRYEYLSADVADDPDPWEPDPDDLAAIEEELRAAVERMRTNDDWTGVADANVCSRCSYRSICRDSVTPGEAAWPVLASGDTEGSGIASERPMVDPRSPVVVGVGQVSQRVAPADARAPIDLLADASRLADADSTATRSLLDRVDVVGDRADRFVARIPIRVRCSRGSSASSRAPRWSRRSAATARSCSSTSSRSGSRQNELDVALVGGAESMHTRWRARREPRVELTWDTGDDAPCEWVIGDDRPGASDYEMSHSALAPPLVYPLFETALRAAAGRSVEEHQRHVSELWAEFAAVATTNPNAWSQQALTAEEIRTVVTRQPHGVLPVPEAHVRQHRRRSGRRGPAVLLRDRARRPAISDDRMVFLHAAAEAHDHYFFTERWTLTDSPAIATTVGDALDAAGLTLDDIARFDLYSCFPSAVQVAVRSLGLAADDPASAHRHRRARLRGRAGQQLPDPRDRAHGRVAPRRSR